MVCPNRYRRASISSEVSFKDQCSNIVEKRRGIQLPAEENGISTDVELPHKPAIPSPARTDVELFRSPPPGSSSPGIFMNASRRTQPLRNRRRMDEYPLRIAGGGQPEKIITHLPFAEKAFRSESTEGGPTGRDWYRL